MSPAIADVLPLSPVQEGLLFHSVAGSGADDPYLVQIRFTVARDLSATQLRSAVAALLERHANLRACFRYRGLDRPVQVIPRRARVPWAEATLSEPAGSDTELRRLLAADRAKGFDLARPPLVRATLVHRAEGTELILTFHHILLDGWSVPILQRDLAALAEGRALPPAVPYQRYAAWLARQDQAHAEQAWLQALAGLEPPVPLAPDRAGEAAEETDLAEARLPAELTTALAGAAARAGVTLNTVVQTAWALVLARSTGARDLVFGGVVAGRTTCPECRRWSGCSSTPCRCASGCARRRACASCWPGSRTSRRRWWRITTSSWRRCSVRPAPAPGSTRCWHSRTSPAAPVTPCPPPRWS
ncbi:hypothetical protein GXW82_04450 [Streptacidiphilus sp. 4-A2]|nr:hypothetical protein [Streptacidiphilus sp. 4-A2]